ncbi:MAG TPA: hypothetical protein VHB79_10785 [Polyangiaceae bacterium]|nr:hypothetical protein [Polyangiaceae bacterium]
MSGRTLHTHSITTPLFTRQNSAPIATRVTLAVAAALRQQARAHGTTQAAVLRRLIQLAISAEGPAGTDALAAVIEALGLSPDVTRDQIVAAIDALVSPPGAGGATGNEALADVADPKPAPKPPALSRAAAPSAPELTPEQAAACRRHGKPATLAGWKALCARTVRRVDQAPPAAAASQHTRSTPAVECPAPFTAAEISWGDRNGVPRAELRQHLADRRAALKRR